MATPKEAFDAFCKRYKMTPFVGGADSVTQLLAAQTKIAAIQIDYFQSLFRSGKELTIHFDYVNHGGLNAFAGYEDPYGLVGINRGAIFLIKDMFQRMLSHPEVLSWIHELGIEVMFANSAN
jgi:hypothetical protein